MFEDSYSFDAAHTGQSYIDQDYVGSIGAYSGKRLFDRAKASCAEETFGAADQRSQIVAEFTVIFDDRDSKRAGSPW